MSRAITKLFELIEIEDVSARRQAFFQWREEHVVQMNATITVTREALDDKVAAYVEENLAVSLGMEMNRHKVGLRRVLSHHWEPSKGIYGEMGGRDYTATAFVLRDYVC